MVIISDYPVDFDEKESHGPDGKEEDIGEMIIAAVTPPLASPFDFFTRFNPFALV